MTDNSLFIYFSCCLLFASSAYAFGSGNIANDANLGGRAFRHGDIVGVLVDCVKVYAGSQLAKDLLAQRPQSFGQRLGARAKHWFKAAENVDKDDIKFDEYDVALVYFGNWLRDLSQALDVGIAKTIGPGLVVNVISLMGFTTFSRGSGPFEVTPERLGCYRPEEHIDNPKGYPDGEPEGADPRELAAYDKLRGPVTRKEVEVDEKTGMKRYIADESGDWSTSSAYIRSSLVKAIELGRTGLRGNRKDYYEALRQLGQALHVFEDFPAHSNFIELSLIKMGHESVCPYVGSDHFIKCPKGKSVAPLVTGTFGGADAIFSMLGEVEDKMSQIGVGDLSKKLAQSKENHDHSGGTIHNLVSRVLGDSSNNRSKERRKNKRERHEKKEKSEARRNSVNSTPSSTRSRHDNTTGETDDSDDESDDENAVMAKIRDFKADLHPAKDVHKLMVGVFKLHDTLSRKVSGVAKFNNDASLLSTFAFATLEPILAPIIIAVEEALTASLRAVIEKHEMGEDLRNPDNGDPSHSVLAKDHFINLLNGPAGLLAQILLRNVVKLVAKGWNDSSLSAEELANEAVSFLHHPYFADEKNSTHQEMQKFVRTWLDAWGDEKEEVLSRLTVDGVINHKNRTIGLKTLTSGLQGLDTLPDKNNKAREIARLGLWGMIAWPFVRVFEICTGRRSKQKKDVKEE